MDPVETIPVIETKVVDRIIHFKDGSTTRQYTDGTFSDDEELDTDLISQYGDSLMTKLPTFMVQTITYVQGIGYGLASCLGLTNSVFQYESAEAEAELKYNQSDMIHVSADKIESIRIP